MKMRDALNVLSGRLIFGDENQIIARKFIESVEEAADKIRSCNICVARMDSRGEVLHHRCTEGFAADVRQAAIDKINDY